MVDNENQWDDAEYSDDIIEYDDTQEYSDDTQEYTDDTQEYTDDNQEYYDYDESQSELDSDDTSSEYSEEDYKENYEEEGYEDEEGQEDNKPSKKTNSLPLIILALILLGAGGFFAVSKLSNNNDTDKIAETATTQQQDDSLFASSSEDDPFFSSDNESTSDMMNVDFNDEGDAQVKSPDDANETVATIKNDSSDNDLFAQPNDLGNEKTNENNDIIISYDKTATRINPFKPPFANGRNGLPQQYAMVQNTEFEIIEPPTESVPDPNLTKLLQTQISGILYDDVSPSAIVNLNGVDTFVKQGDTIYGFTIGAITRNKVQISYRNNTYVAAVGELFTPGTIDKPTVANLEKKFAGRYK